MINLTRILFYVSLLLVLYFSLVNASEIPYFESMSYISDKLVHSFIYFYLAILGILSKFRLNDLKVVALIFLFGAFIEFIHYYHPYRFFEFFDLLANLIGVTIAFLIFRLKNKLTY
ncbi:VanZ family protein [Gammaproteobacteria bacterium]|nr:VanZ family protein [Gammaproteobacteria bacterium]